MDDDDKKPEDEPPEPARDAAQDQGAEPRKVSEEELKQILATHETWLETDGKEGSRADLSQTDLQGANLNGANLEGANLTKAIGLTRVQLDFACGDEKTKLPVYLGDYQMKACSEPALPPSN